MTGTCAFCGFSGKLTGEHVFGDWLTRIGLDLGPVPHSASRLNRIGQELGVRPPFRQTVRDVCGTCNHGWMSQLEVVAQRVLTPFILGMAGTIWPEDQGTVVAWAQKTALVAMLVSPEEDRTAGYGLPAAGYRDLYALRDEAQPLPASQLWIGRYDGVRGWSVRVTPLVVTIEGLLEPDRPQGYVMTVVLGQLVLRGVRFTTPSPPGRGVHPAGAATALASHRACAVAARFHRGRRDLPQVHRRQGTPLDGVGYRAAAVEAGHRPGGRPSCRRHHRAAHDVRQARRVLPRRPDL